MSIDKGFLNAINKCLSDLRSDVDDLIQLQSNTTNLVMVIYEELVKDGIIQPQGASNEDEPAH